MDEYVEVKHLRVELAILFQDHTWRESGEFLIERDSIEGVEYGLDDGAILDAAVEALEELHGRSELNRYALLSWEDVYEDEEEEGGE